MKVLAVILLWSCSYAHRTPCGGGVKSFTVSNWTTVFAAKATASSWLSIFPATGRTWQEAGAPELTILVEVDFVEVSCILQYLPTAAIS